MIRDYRNLLIRIGVGDAVGLMVEGPERPGGRNVWSLSQSGERVHATTAKAAKARGFPLAQCDLFAGGES